MVGIILIPRRDGSSETIEVVAKGETGSAKCVALVQDIGLPEAAATKTMSVVALFKRRESDPCRSGQASRQEGGAADPACDRPPCPGTPSLTIRQSCAAQKRDSATSALKLMARGSAAHEA